MSDTADLSRIPEPRQYYSNEDFLNRGMDEIRELRTAITRLQEQLTTAKADAWDEAIEAAMEATRNTPLTKPFTLSGFEARTSIADMKNPYRATPEDDNA